VGAENKVQNSSHSPFHCTQNIGIQFTTYELHIPCQDVNIGEIQDMIELYKVSYWFARTKDNIPLFYEGQDTTSWDKAKGA